MNVKCFQTVFEVVKDPQNSPAGREACPVFSLQGKRREAVTVEKFLKAFLFFHYIDSAFGSFD